MDKSVKIELFKRFCAGIVKKCKTLNVDGDAVSYGTAISNRLLFISIVSLGQKDRMEFDIKVRDELLSIFDNFYALPTGVCESDCLNWIHSDAFKNYSFDDVYEFGSFKFCVVGANFEALIQKAVDAIPEYFFEKSLFEISDIVLGSESWRDAYEKAVSEGKKTWKMNPEKIKCDDMLYMVHRI